MEKHFVFIKNNRVMQIAVFAERDEELADAVARELGFDDAVWIGEDIPPAMWSEYNSADGSFTPSTKEYLVSIGVLNPSALNEIPTE